MALLDQRVLTILKVDELGSFTKAADALCLTQPAVSQQVKSFENELDIKIFEREQKTVRLTKNGEVALKYIKRLVSISNNMVQAIKDEKMRVTSLAVGITHTVESSTIIEAIAEFTRDNQGVSIKIVSDTAENLHRMLRNDELDFLIIEGRLDDSDLNYTMLGTDSLVLVTSPTHRLASRKAVTIEDLKKENLILRLPNSNTRYTFEKSLRKQNLHVDDFNVILEIENIATIKDLIRRDFGVSILAKSTCMDELKKGKIAVQDIEHLSMVREINIVSMNSFEHPEVIQGIIDRYRAFGECIYDFHLKKE
ncbi:MAG: LysR family transcriptional regulator [Spirochaetales bacterium]|nr:LysR family transcriptional regulator [Spirochaetales bacterium]